MMGHPKPEGDLSKSATVLHGQEKILVGDVKLSKITWALLLAYR
jgi:hypothetical protein